VKQKSILTINEISKAFDVPAHMVRTSVKNGCFPILKSGSRVYIVPEVFENYLKSGGAIYDTKA
jgi:hypothetical protein